MERLERLEPERQWEWVVVVERLNLELLNRRKALNVAKRLNVWNDWNGGLSVRTALRL
jgi:hypothetical protein